jgi:hypothetical protein
MASTKVPFSCDSSFCPHCGTLFPLPGTSEVVNCLFCSYKVKASVFEGVEEYSCKVFTVKRAISKKEESVDGPLVQYLLLQVSVWH